MEFFKSVFSDDPDSSDLQRNQISESESHKESPAEEEEEEEVEGREVPLNERDSDLNPSPGPAGGAGWNFGGLFKTLATKSESVLQTYRHDLEEFSSGLKKETEVIREAASRAVKELPVSIDVGASAAQESLESVGQAIDDFGSSVWRGTAEIISQGKDALLAADLEGDSSDSQHFRNPNLNSKRYSRFEAQVHAIQTDLGTYCEEPEDLDDFNKWKSGFVLEEKAEEAEDLCGKDGVMEGIYTKLVPNAVDRETFWSRYFYRVYKLKQVRDARANLVKRVISREEEEELSWDVDDDDDEETSAPELEGAISENKELEKKCSSEFVLEKRPVEDSELRSSGIVAEMGKSCGGETDENGHVAESFRINESDKVLFEGKADLSGSNGNELVAKSEEKAFLEVKSDPGESSKDSDFSVVSSQPSLPEEEDLGWDEIEDLGSNDEKKVTIGGSPNRADLCKRLSAADEEEDLTWDIEDEDEPVKP